jgi:hypothetical protein
MKVYSIKYLETKGVEEFDVEATDFTRDGKYVSIQLSDMRRFEGMEATAFRVKAEAIQAGIKKLKSVRESLSRRSRKVTELICDLELMKDERT